MKHFVAATVLVTACNQLPDPELCRRGPTPEQVAREFSQAPEDRVDKLHAEAEACVVHRSYDYAPSRDPVEDVVNAVLIACRPSMNTYDAAADPGGRGFNSSTMRNSMRAKAFEIVVRARAGHCG